MPKCSKTADGLTVFAKIANALKRIFRISHLRDQSDWIIR